MGKSKGKSKQIKAGSAGDISALIEVPDAIAALDHRFVTRDWQMPTTPIPHRRMVRAAPDGWRTATIVLIVPAQSKELRHEDHPFSSYRFVGPWQRCGAGERGLGHEEVLGEPGE